MKYIIYLRVSTNKQDDGQQNRTVESYCERNKITPHCVITEMEHSSVRFEDRALMDALNIAKKGDQIICSESSRVVRNGFDEMYRIKQKCAEIGCTIYCIAENLCYGAEEENAKESDEMISIIRMAVASGTSKMERSLIRMRSKSSLDLRKDEIKKNGFFIAKKSKRVVKKLGDPDHERLQKSALKGSYASADSRKKKKQADTGFRQTYELAQLLFDSGLKNPQIASRLNESGYRTPKGCDFLPATVSRLLKDGKKLLNNS